MATGSRHRLLKGTPNTGITTAYSSALPIVKQGSSGQSPRISGHVSGLFLFVSSIVSATALTVVVSEDILGDRPVIPSTAGAIQTGMTTASKGGVVIRVDIQIYDAEEPLYVFAKTDQGTLVIDDIILTYGE